MYALANIEKLVADNREVLGDKQCAEILERARALAHDGLLVAMDIDQIMPTPELARRAHTIMMMDPDHIRIGLEMMRIQQLWSSPSAKTDDESPPVEPVPDPK